MTDSLPSSKYPTLNMASVSSNLETTTFSPFNAMGDDYSPPLLPKTFLPDNLQFHTHQSHTHQFHTLKSDELNQHTQEVVSQDAFIVDWTSVLNDDVLNTFVADGFVVLDAVYTQTALLALQAESGFIDYRDALLTDGIHQTDIRGDRIRWITRDFFAGFYYLQSINELAHFFNRTLFAGIRHSEAHYARYPAGFGYKWHTDNPIGRDERVISAVFYLNDDWTPEDGGALSLIDNKGASHQLLPKANRLVIFDSNLRHQVEIAYRQRYSIATWLRRDDAIDLLNHL